jgi:hypothetical protein
LRYVAKIVNTYALLQGCRFAGSATAVERLRDLLDRGLDGRQFGDTDTAREPPA